MIKKLSSIFTMLVAGAGIALAQTEEAPLYQQVICAEEMPPGTVVIIGTTSETEEYSPLVLTGQEKCYMPQNKGLAGVSADIHNGIVRTRDAIRMTVGEEDGRYTFANDEGKMLNAMMYSANKVFSFGPRALGTNVHTFELGFEDNFNARLDAHMIGDGYIIHYDSFSRNEFFTAGKTSNPSNIQIYREITGELPSENTTLSVDGTLLENGGSYSFITGTSVSVSTDAESDFYVASPEGINLAESKTYTFTPTESGRYIFFTRNEAGRSVGFTVNLHILRPNPIGIYSNGKDLESGAEVFGSPQMTVTSPDHDKIVVLFNDAPFEELSGEQRYTMKLAKPGKYTFYSVVQGLEGERFELNNIAKYEPMKYIEELDGATPFVIASSSAPYGVWSGTATESATAIDSRSYRADKGVRLTASKAESGAWLIKSEDGRSLALNGSTPTLSEGEPTEFDLSVDSQGKARISPVGSEMTLRYIDESDSFTFANAAEGEDPVIFRNIIGSPTTIFYTYVNGNQYTGGSPVVCARGGTATVRVSTFDHSDFTFLAVGPQSRHTAPVPAGECPDLEVPVSGTAGEVWEYSLVLLGDNGASNEVRISLLSAVPEAVSVKAGDVSIEPGSTVPCGEVRVTSANSSSIKITAPDGTETVKGTNGGSIYYTFKTAGLHQFTGILGDMETEPFAVTAERIYRPLLDASDIGYSNQGLTFGAVNPDDENDIRVITSTAHTSGADTWLEGTSATLSEDGIVRTTSGMNLSLSTSPKYSFLNADRNYLRLDRTDEAMTLHFGESASSFSVKTDKRENTLISPTDAETELTMRYDPESNVFLFTDTNIGWPVKILKEYYTYEAPQELQSDNLPNYYDLLYDNPGKRVRYTGTATVTGRYGNEVWLVDETGAASICDEDLPEELKRGHLLLNGFVGRMDRKTHVLSLATLIDMQDVAVTEIPLPEKKQSFDDYYDYCRYVEVNGTFKVSDEGNAYIEVDGSPLCFIEPVITAPTTEESDSRSLAETDSPNWCVGDEWLSQDYADVYASGFVDSYKYLPINGESVELLTLRADRINGIDVITGTADIVSDNGISVSGQDIIVPEGSRIYNLAGFMLSDGVTSFHIQESGIYIVAVPGGKAHKIIIR